MVFQWTVHDLCPLFYEVGTQKICLWKILACSAGITLSYEPKTRSVGILNFSSLSSPSCVFALFSRVSLNAYFSSDEEVYLINISAIKGETESGFAAVFRNIDIALSSVGFIPRPRYSLSKGVGLWSIPDESVRIGWCTRLEYFRINSHAIYP